WDLLFELAGRGVTLLVTTHYMDEAERCTDVGYIYHSRLLVVGKPSDLKSLPEVTPPGTRRFELTTANAPAHLTELRQLDGVRDATLFGDTIHLLADDKLSPAEIAQNVHDGGEKVDVRPISPTLEDVFVTLTRSAEERRARGEQMPPTVRANDEAVDDE